MLRFLVRRSSKKTNFSCVQLRNLYSTKGTGNDDSSEVKSWSVEPVHPLKRILNCIKRDGAEMKRNIMFWKDDKNKAMQPGQVIDWDDPSAPIFSNHVDIVIIGGGAMGSAIAYFCQKLMTEQARIVVVEKDPTYMQASTVLSVGGLRQQFSLEENVEMSLFGAEFIRNANEYLGIPGEPAIDLQFHPYGYLSLATAETAEILQNNSTLQNAIGAKNILLTATQLKNKFSWLNVDGIELGCLGLEKEGWFDPWSLLIALKRKAISLGVEYVKAEVKGFNFENQPSVVAVGVKSGEYEALNYLVVQTEDGKLRPITFSKCIVAAGAFSVQIAKMAKIGYGKDILSVPLPVEPRKRYVYCFHAPDGPGLNTPMTIDPTGTYFRREGLANHYICGRCPPEDEEPSVDNLEVDSEFFNTNIWPILAQRVKAFESLKVKSSWAGYYEYNTFDENGIVGYHPYYNNLLFATGFSGHGIQHAPAVGQAVAELIRYQNYQTVDLTRLSFDRFITLQPMKEVNIW